jgi:hypothetical protein
MPEDAALNFKNCWIHNWRFQRRLSKTAFRKTAFKTAFNPWPLQAALGWWGLGWRI